MRDHCETCGVFLTPRAKHRRTEKRPTADELEAMIEDASARATDGCEGVEADGTCVHGHEAWPRALGLL